MDFARKQLEKYGWTDGKGLGKNENGIAQALKPKLKRSVTGIGHDAASDFTEHWWTQLYNKAAGNVEVEDKDGKTKKIKTKDKDGFEITNSTWKINKKLKKMDQEEQYADYFVRKAVLTNDGCRMENIGSDEGSENEEEVKKDVFKMTDEELFAACEGRTAHKGARHGLKATGKLARIAQQEQMLLTLSQYDGYSHAKKRKAQENSSNNQIEEPTNCEKLSNSKKQKKKKRKETESENSLPVDCEKSNSVSVASDDSSRKSKKIKNENCDADETTTVDSSEIIKKKKKKRKSENRECDQNSTDAISEEGEEITEKKSKKKKKLKKDVVDE